MGKTRNSLFSSLEVKKYVSNTGYMFFGKILNSFLALFTGIYIARYLAPTDFGLYQYASSYIILFGAFASLGLRDIFIKEIVNAQKSESIILGTILNLRILSGFVFSLLAILASYFTNESDISRLLIIVCSISLIFESAEILDYWFQAKVLAKRSQIANVISLLVASSIKILFIYLSLSVVYFSISIVLYSAFRLLLMIWQFQKQGAVIKIFSFDLEIIKDFLFHSWPLIIASLSTVIAMKIDQVMIMQMMSAASTGIYAAGIKLAEASSFLPTIIVTSIFPKLIQLHRKPNFWLRYRQIFKYVFWALIVLSLMVTFLSGFIINLFFGLEYQGAAQVLAIYIWTLPLSFSGMMTVKYMLLLNKTKAIFIRQLIATVGNILLNLILIPKYGFVGAAFSTIVPQFLINTFYDFVDKDLKEILKIKKEIVTFNFFGR
ncbi:flippase [Leeuwenhoekiella palythoae]|uniref:flippase n=1 Tax=Leeuwenhoekiella palythoae TaxID=573501 RepID=UPI000FFEAF69|nr:flippase [Leeuwenhoekiella palythoae]